MAKRKNKKTRGKVPPEAQERVQQACAKLVDRLPADESLSLFFTAAGELAGYEAVLIAALAETRSVKVLNFLYHLTTVLEDKALVKEAKRAVYRLEQAGLAADEKIKPVRTSLLKPPPRREPSGFLSEYDSEGMRLGLLAIPVAPSGYVTGVFLVSQALGLTDLDDLHLNASEVKKLMTELGGETHLRLVEMPVGHVRLVLAEAAARALDIGRSLPEDYTRFIALAGNLPLAERPAVYDLPLADQALEQAGLESSVEELLDHDFLRSFVLTDELRPYLSKIDAVNNSALILSEAQKIERIQVIYDQAGDEIYDSEK
ncbi:MAG: hypothetical protein SV487_09830, partial [Thermodesulfobacteriota bacterium]|nr:hypothetical protein [Thermodesulfobacteriota bacterium]